MKMRPDLTPRQLAIGREMRHAVKRSSWYTGDLRSLNAGKQDRVVASTVEPELVIRLLFTKDRMHHSVGWWRNADYECCWHLSMSALLEADYPDGYTKGLHQDIPDEDVRVWGHALFGDYVRWVWHEPGGTDPRLTPEEKRHNRRFCHLRLFIHHEPPHQPIFPEGEVYHLKRWVPGLTPEKVDR